MVVCIALGTSITFSMLLFGAALQAEMPQPKNAIKCNLSHLFNFKLRINKVSKL